MSFPLVSNSRIENYLCSAIAEHRLPHALLIEGDKGTGRHTLAWYIASSVVCSGENVPCGQCKGCKLLEARSHPDIFVTSPEENKKGISVSQIRLLRSETIIKPHLAPKRVFIIDKSDTMNEQAQNALLKILEEPPATVIFILIAESKEFFLDTVVSRCTILSTANPLKDDAYHYLLKTGLYDKNEISEALQKSNNNIGKAITFLKGATDYSISESAQDFFEFLLVSDDYSMLKICNQYEKDRTSAEEFIKCLKNIISQKIKSEYKKISLTSELFSLYNSLSLYQQSIKTNINLNLLFCCMVSNAVKLMK